MVKGEKVHSVAEIVLLNKEKVVGGVVDQHLEEIAYKAEPSALVEKVIVDCSNLKLGDTLKVADLEIAKDKDIDITTHMDAPVVSVIVPRNAEIPDDDKEEETAE